MTVSDEKLKEIQDELKWVTVSDNEALTKRMMSKGIIGVLVPVGCIATTAVLFSGVYNMFKKDSRKQQKLMRYRVLAQGVTVLLTTVGMFQLKFSS